MRHLLLWLKVSGIKSGYLFPDLVNSQLEDGKYSMRMSYPYFLRFLKDLAINVLGRDVTDHIFGTHILRKTGYLFAIWGVLRGCGGDGKREPSDIMMANILTSARHKSAGCVMSYALDAFAQQSGSSRAGYDTSRNLVKFWEPVHLVDKVQFRANCVGCLHLQKPLPGVVDWYFNDFLKVQYTTIVLCS